MLLIYLLLLGTVAKGMVATVPTTNTTTNDEISTGPSTTSASFDSTSIPPSNHTNDVFTSTTAFPTNSTISVPFTTTESVMTESTSVTPTTTPSTHLPDASTTSEAVTGNETDNNSLTTSSPPDVSSTPTSGATTITTNPENGQSNITTTGGTVLTTVSTKPTEPVTTSNSTVTTTSPALTTTATTNTNVTNLPTTESTSNTTTAAPPIPTPGPPIVCPAKPCPFESTCLNGTCQCISGTFLQNGECQRVQVFPGQLHITSIEFTEGMSNRSTAIFQSTAEEIISALRLTLQNDPGYLGSEVLQLLPGSVIASVNNNFRNTSLTQASVNAIIQNSSTGVLKDATFTGTNLCETKPLACDAFSTTCSVQKGMAVCSCKEGFVPLESLYSRGRVCRACPSGQRAVGDMCEPCAFGYSGVNCNDSALLAVVVISCVLGGVLLLLVLALLIYCCWKCCSKDKPDFESSPYSSGDLNQPWPTGITPIPRATTNWESGAAMEMTEGGSTNNLVDKKHQTNGLTGSYDLNPEDMKTFKGKNTSRYSYLVQGHENPYFLPGDDRKS